MKIIGHDGTGGPNRTGEVPGARGDVKRRQGTRQGTTTADDKVTVSDEARRLAQLRADLSDVGGVRTEKVEEIRGKIERGEFHVDLKAVARKFLESILGERKE